MSKSDSVLFKVDINNYKGPLEVLLDLAKAQKVDLEEISITQLADEFLKFINRAINKNSEAISKLISLARLINFKNSSANCVMDMSAKSTFCAFARSSKTSRGPE
jgi:segregation and condensation protein A